MTVANDWLNAAHEQEDLEKNAQYMKDVPQEQNLLNKTHSKPAEDVPVEIDNEEEPNEQPDVSEV